jgi:hypothetical protein
MWHIQGESDAGQQTAVAAADLPKILMDVSSIRRCTSCACQSAAVRFKYGNLTDWITVYAFGSIQSQYLHNTSMLHSHCIN